MIPRIRTKVLPRGVVGRSRPATIAEDGLCEGGKIAAGTEGKRILSHIVPDLGNYQWNAIDDGEFAQAGGIGAVQGSFENMAVGFGFYMSQLES